MGFLGIFAEPGPDCGGGEKHSRAGFNIKGVIVRSTIPPAAPGRRTREIWGRTCPTCRAYLLLWRHSPKYKGEKPFLAEFWTKLGMEPAAKNPPDLRILEYTTGGRVKSLTVNGRKIQGETFRRLLGLNSSCFSWRLSADGIFLQTTGYGHGVGLCQYGADGLARQGWDFRSILKYYYRGVDIVRLQIRG